METSSERIQSRIHHNALPGLASLLAPIDQGKKRPPAQVVVSGLHWRASNETGECGTYVDDIMLHSQALLLSMGEVVSKVNILESDSTTTQGKSYLLVRTIIVAVFGRQISALTSSLNDCVIDCV